MALYAISVCDMVLNEALKKLLFKSIIKCLKKEKIYKWPEISL